MQLDFKYGHQHSRRSRQSSFSAKSFVAHPFIRSMGKVLVGIGIVCTVLALVLAFLRSQLSWKDERSIGFVVLSENKDIEVRSHTHIVWIRPQETAMIVARYPDELLLNIPIARKHALSALPTFFRLDSISSPQQMAIYSLGLRLPLTGIVNLHKPIDSEHSLQRELIRALVQNSDTGLSPVARLTLAWYLFIERFHVETKEFPQTLFATDESEPSAFGKLYDAAAYTNWITQTFSPASSLQENKTIAISNASGRAGVARTLANQLEPMGFLPIGITDAPVADETKMYIKQGEKDTTSIRFIESLLGVEATLDEDVVTRARADIVVIIGKKEAQNLIP